MQLVGKGEEGIWRCDDEVQSSQSIQCNVVLGDACAKGDMFWVEYVATRDLE